MPRTVSPHLSSLVPQFVGPLQTTFADMIGDHLMIAGAPYQQFR
jgi:hypothetical protein